MKRLSVGMCSSALLAALASTFEATPVPPQKSLPAIEHEPPPGRYPGYGRTTTGGGGGGTCTFSSEAQLVECLSRGGGPLNVVAAPGFRTITLASDLIVRRANTTVDCQGRIAFTGSRRTFAVGATDNVILRGCRFRDMFKLEIDGAAGRRKRASRVVVANNTIGPGMKDGALDMWYEVSDVAIVANLLYGSRRGGTFTHYPAPFRVRQRISVLRNVYAKNPERNPQLRADTRDLDFRNNVVYGWSTGGFGYGTRIRAEPGQPAVNGNFVGNAYASSGHRCSALIIRNAGGPIGRLHFSGNLLPPGCSAPSSTGEEVVPPDTTTLTAAESLETTLPAAGAPNRTSDEQALIDEVRAAFP